MDSLGKIYRLGIKELWSLWRDPAMLLLILYSFTLNIYVAGTALPQSLHKAPIAIVDEDQSALSQRIRDAFYPPDFLPPVLTRAADADSQLERGVYTFVLTIPAEFQADLLAGRSPKIQLSIDATRMGQAFSGNGHIERLVNLEAQEFFYQQRPDLLHNDALKPVSSGAAPVSLELRARFNPTLAGNWFGSVMELINSITLISIVLTGAALIREREHGTIEHLLVMPVSPLQIMLSKVWAMALVVLLCTAGSLVLMVQQVLQIGINGSVPLFLACSLLHLLATTSLGIFMATLARSMPQFGLLLMMTLLPLQMLSGGITPRESMPELVQYVMLAAPTTHFVSAAQAVLFRGAGLASIWPQLLALLAITVLLFSLSWHRFRQALGSF